MDLSKSAFFDGRTIGFLQRLLHGRTEVAAMTGPEQKLIERKKELVNLDDDLEYSLIEKLSKYKSYVPVLDAIDFLLAASELNLLREAVIVLDQSVRDEKVLTSVELDQVLEEIVETPPEWIVNLIGMNGEDRHKKQPKKPVSSLNLEAMKNFK